MDLHDVTRPVAISWRLSALAALLVGCAGSHASGKPKARPAADAGHRDAGDRDGAVDAASEAAAPDEDAAVVADAGSDAAVPLPAPVVRDDSLFFDPVTVQSDGTVTVDFDLPADALSFVLTLDPKTTPRRVDLLQVVAPDGTVLFDASVKGPQPFDPGVSSSVSDPLPYSVMLPSSPETPFATGHYQVQLGVAAAPAGADPSVALDVVWKRALTPPTSGKLALGLWFVQGAMLDAASAQTDQNLQAALMLTRDIYSAAGIDLSLEYRDLRGADAQKFSTVHDELGVAQLLELLRAEASDAPVLPIVVIDSLESAPGKTVRGKTSGLPGPPASAGLARAGGVIIALSTLPSSSRQVGELLAHEAAHYLGLRHTSEYDGVRHDPIADTPECPADRASRSTSNGMALLRAEDCSDLDGHNLMFYTPLQLDRSQHELTQGQAFVLLRNPLVL
jgi:hypothetical protein